MSTPSFFFSGRIDEASIYSRALGAGEITSIYDAGPAGRMTAGPYLTTSGQLPEGYLGQTYTHTYLSARGTGSISYSVAAGALPSGLTLSSAGVLSGLPANSGTFGFVVRATDGAGLFGEQLCLLRIYGPAFGAPGLVAWWRSENDAQDAAGTNHGVLRNGATFAAGKVGSAFLLDGVDDYVEVADTGALHPPSTTLEAWVLFSAVTGERTIFSKPPAYRVFLSDGRLFADLNGGFEARMSAPFSPVAGRWYHLAHTVDGPASRHALYVDGTLLVAAAGIKTSVEDTESLRFGYGTSGVDIFSGRIDEAALYNRALSSFEIASIYNSGASGKLLPSTIERWKLASLGNANAPDFGDPDGDGLETLVEYGLSTDPNAVSVPPFVDLVTDMDGTSRQRIHFVRDPARNDITVTVESSSDLQTWAVIATSANGSPFGGSATILGETPGTAPRMITVIDENPVPSAPERRFVRIEVSR